MKSEESLLVMAKRIPFQYTGSGSNIDRLSIGLADMASMRHGVVKHNRAGNCVFVQERLTSITRRDPIIPSLRPRPLWPAARSRFRTPRTPGRVSPLRFTPLPPSDPRQSTK